jgi:hypothetical protein
MNVTGQGILDYIQDTCPDVFKSAARGTIGSTPETGLNSEVQRLFVKLILHPLNLSHNFFYVVHASEIRAEARFDHPLFTASEEQLIRRLE